MPSPPHVPGDPVRTIRDLQLFPSPHEAVKLFDEMYREMLEIVHGVPRLLEARALRAMRLSNSQLPSPLSPSYLPFAEAFIQYQRRALSCLRGDAARVEAFARELRVRLAERVRALMSRVGSRLLKLRSWTAEEAELRLDEAATFVRELRVRAHIRGRSGCVAGADA